MLGQLLKLSYVAPTYHQAQPHLPATANTHPPATQKTVKSGKNAKNPTSSQKFISSRWKNSSLFLFVRLNCTMLRCKAPPALLPIGPRGPRLYFLLRRLHHAKFLKDITEITTQPKLTFLPYCWPYGGMGLSLWDRWTDGQHTWAGGAGGYLLDHRRNPRWTQK